LDRYIRLSHAHELFGNLTAAKDALAHGLRQKCLKNKFGLADRLILLQTDKRGLSPEKVGFQRRLLNIQIVEGHESAGRMRDLGAWKGYVERSSACPCKSNVSLFRVSSSTSFQLSLPINVQIVGV
jgi:hypothetical protein